MWFWDGVVRGVRQMLSRWQRNWTAVRRSLLYRGVCAVNKVNPRARQLKSWDCLAAKIRDHRDAGPRTTVTSLKARTSNNADTKDDIVGANKAPLSTHVSCLSRRSSLLVLRAQVSLSKMHAVSAQRRSE